MRCPACQGEVAPGLDHCPACRARGSASRPTPEAAPATDRHERFFLIVACLFAVGAFALPRLRRSKAFGPTGKRVLGTLAIVNTAAAVAVLLAIPLYGPRLVRAWTAYLERHAGIGRDW